MFNAPQVRKLESPEVLAVIDAQGTGRSLDLSGARMVANGMDSCTESESSLPITNNDARSAVATSSCAFMLINFVLLLINFVLLLDAPICCTPQLQVSAVGAQHWFAQCVVALSVQMSDADDRQARALVPEGPADDEATSLNKQPHLLRWTA